MATSELDKSKTVIYGHQTPVGYNEFLVDQILAADDALKAITELKKAKLLDPKNESHRAILETDVFKLRRGLCLPCAASTAINQVLGYRLIGDTSGILTIGDYFRVLFPHHGSYPTPENPKGWLITTPSGDMYHHAIIAFAQGLGITAYSCQGFTDVSEFQPILEIGGGVTVSLNNHFVIEQTLAAYPETVEVIDSHPHIKVLTKTGSNLQPFQNGKHVVTLLDIRNSEAIVADSFNLPQTNTHGLTATLPLETLNKYLIYSDHSVSRGIAFLPPNTELPHSLHPIQAYIPSQVTQKITREITKRLTSQQN